MLNVAHRITIGSAVYASAAHSRLIRLRTNAGLAAPVNTAVITFAPPHGLTIAVGDTAVVELGYDDDLHVVFTGIVESFDWAVESVTVGAASTFRRLLDARYNRIFERSKSGDIVSNVARQLEIATGTVESGLELAAYAMSSGLSAYDAVRVLAGRSGFDFYADIDDKLVFARYNQAQAHPFQYGINIVELAVEHSRDRVTGVEVYGESPSSLGEGQDAYSWLTKKDVKGTAGGSSGVTVQHFDPTIRTQEDAGAIAESLLSALGAGRTCRLQTLGAPEVRLGEAIEISDMPIAEQNGTFKVTGVAHRLDLRQGFTSWIDGIEA
ncbi:MAG: hypothetical protein IPK19_10815 [Chloroflexi bacterium]|nr:hypothetical protein [Chloroflexota bacterium]